MKASATGLVYRNALPHVYSRHAYFPSLVVRPDGSLLVAFDIGSAFEAIDVRSFVTTSRDGGATWCAPVQMYEPDTSRHAVSVTTRIGQGGDGSLFTWAALFERSRLDLGLVDPVNDGFVPITYASLRSTDGGRTWTPPRPVRPTLPWGAFEVCSPPVEVSAGRWLIPTSPLKEFSGRSAEPSLPPGIAWTSPDGGQTLDGHVVTFAPDADGQSALEQKLTRLSDGRWLVVCWSIGADGKTRPNRYAVSTDATATAFGPWRSTGMTGETCTPVALSDRQVLCVYRNFERGGLWGQLAKLSADGDAWVAVEDLCLWDGSNAPRRGSAERFAVLREMKDLRFGYPSVARLPDGDVLIVYWCVEQCVSNIRWIRVAMA